MNTFIITVRSKDGALPDEFFAIWRSSFPDDVLTDVTHEQEPVTGPGGTSRPLLDQLVKLEHDGNVETAYGRLSCIKEMAGLGHEFETGVSDDDTHHEQTGIALSGGPDMTKTKSVFGPSDRKPQKWFARRRTSQGVRTG